MSTLKAPTEKLPLTARKNIRDEWETKKPKFEEEMTKILGETWTIDVDVNLVYSYAPDDYAARLGSCITWYIEPFVRNLKRFAEQFGDDGKSELNSTCSEHKLVFAPQEETTFSYGGLAVKDGKLYLVFADGKFPVNVDDISRDFSGALAAAPQSTSGSAYNLIARGSVRDEYEKKIGEVDSKIRKAVGIPDLKLNGNFEAVSEELAKSSKEDWQKRIGYMALSYFKGFEYQLRSHKFEGDDMLQEAFQDAVSKKEICLRVLQKWEDGSSKYNEVVIEDGILYIQTIVQYWGTNVDNAAQKLTDLL